MLASSHRSSRSLACPLLLFLIGGNVPEPLYAQRVWPIGVEGGAGLSWGNTGELYRSHAGIVFDLLAAGAIIQSSSGTIVLAGTFTRQLGVPNDSKCEPKPGGGCKTDFPEFKGVGVLAGVEDESGSKRLLAGPIYVQGDDTAVGLEVRANAFTSPFLHLSLGVLARAAIIPAYDGLTLGLLTGEVMLRIR